MIYFLLIGVFFIAINLYFRAASHFNIIDRPNERSSHSEITIRGGGIIYLLSALAAVFLHHEYWLPVVSFFIIGLISFVDDRIDLSSKIRILFHITAVSLIFNYLNLFTDLPLWAVILLYILVIGIINAYNFMDGINGITGLYTLVVLGGLQYVNYYMTSFIHVDMIWMPILASVVFLYYNFRNRAKCFAGDVGSVTIALWIVFLLLKLIMVTDNYTYILFLAVYGVDAVLTIIHRLMLRQNIFNPHRLHFYQLLANEKGMSHLLVSTIYGLIQLMIILIIVSTSLDFYLTFLVTILPLVLLYSILKPRMMNLTNQLKG